MKVVPVRERGDDDALAKDLAALGVRLTPGEARRIAGLLGRDPTVVEAFLFDAMWSEHCSYKSSRATLALFPTEGRDVILGPGEDAGIVRLGNWAGQRWAIVVGHESHNHPSQIVPTEGAATGIGGIVRDVYCMGADVVAVLDSLRFGDIRGPRHERVKEIVEGVVTGIWQYANALGIPNAGGEVAFDPSYDENCLVNVIALGVVKEEEIVRSRVPAEARKEPYVFVLVGKPTDASGFGGASFASAVLEDEEGGEKGAVQIPDPFLKRVLAEATKEVLRKAREERVAIGFKDLGAGGIACVTSELAAAGGFGMDVDLDLVPVDGGPFPAEVLSISETQERYGFVVPERFAPEVLRVFNEEYELPRLYPNAQATVVGRVRTDGAYRVTKGGETWVDAPATVVTAGIRYDRAEGPPPAPEVETPAFDPPGDLGTELLELAGTPNLCSREHVWRHYDTEVSARAVFRPGEAEAGVFVPVPGGPFGVAVSVDGNSLYGGIDPYLGGVHAALEAVRNVIATGAEPIALTDCLNYGNPEDPAVFRQFREGVRGIADVCRGIGLRPRDEADGGTEPIPVVSGNVSFYNESKGGASILPTPIVCAVGRLRDYALAVGNRARRPGSHIVLIGDRTGALGGSEYLLRRTGSRRGRLHRPDLARERRILYGVLRLIEESGSVLAARDVGEGGVLLAASEMLFGTGLGATLDASHMRGDLRADVALLDETGGFLLEIETARIPDFWQSFGDLPGFTASLGTTTPEPRLRIRDGETTLVDLPVAEIEARHAGALPEYLR